MNWLSNFKIALMFASVVTSFVPSTVLSGTPAWCTEYLTPQAIERNRPPQIVESRFATYLANHPTNQIKVWVFFTDKAISGKAGFETAAASTALTDRARNRRAKVGLDRIVFVDLPVASQYVQTIEGMGARHCRSSRWLNAASFELPASLVEGVSKLPFVSEIRPVMRAQRTPEEETEVRAPAPEEAQSTHALNYGASYAQLNQIGVPAVHDKGYSGEGVTLASLDTGVRKAHQSIASHFAEGRVLAEYDFVHNDGNVDYDPGDWASERNHGTQVFSVAGGCADGQLYGPAYRANFILCKTEDIRSELPIEEDNWVAGMEFADSVGADVITSSLGYLDFDDSCHCDYSYSDMDGQTATTSIAAGMADGLGIVLTKSAGNNGDDPGTITAPADAFGILAVGSVDAGGTIAASSSRGPTADGRTKPEVCARGVNTYMAYPGTTSDNLYTTGSGTSFAAPLVAGAACLLIEAHPEWTPAQVREALKASGNRAGNPDNTYGWGIINVDAALGLGPNCCSGMVGNADGVGDDEPTLADIMALVEFLFVNHEPPACMAEADVNQSGGNLPLKNDITLGDIMRLVDYLYVSHTPLPGCL
jgi:serine protease AprX